MTAMTPDPTSSNKRQSLASASRSARRSIVPTCAPLQPLDSGLKDVDQDKPIPPSKVRNTHCEDNPVANSVQLAYWAQGKMPEKAYSSVPMRKVLVPPWKAV
eukprot:PhF_6_TR12250/c0_g1_i1/m.19412